MFEKLFAKPSPKEAATQEDNDALQIAFAALLIEAARADENYELHEIAMIDRIISGKFALSPSGAAALRAKAETVQAGALDIQRFTRIAKDMPQNEKIAFIEQLWEIVLSDGERDPFEDTLVRRICGLIYVEDRDSGAARARVQAKRAGK